MDKLNNIQIVASKETPYFPAINFDFEKEYCEIVGESYMEDCYKFYEPLAEWLKEYCQLKTNLTFNFKLTYFNSQSSRMILMLLEPLMKFHQAGKTININWYYLRSDPDMAEEVEDFAHETGLDINMIEIMD